MVTANYKLSFDTLRFSLERVDCWLLVVDTRGINVWCAAGKGTFSAHEIASLVKSTKLSKLVSHQELIVPQLGAAGVSAGEVKKLCGFRANFGPIRAEDVEQYIKDGHKASEQMRSVTFTLKERIELIPVELYLQLKTIMIILFFGTLLSGVGPHFFSIDITVKRSLQVLWATLAGLVSGAVMVPILLQYLQGRQFWVKGLWPPLVFFGFLIVSSEITLSTDSIALLFLSVAYSSFLAMNFTGCTPYTSPSGVEFELKRGAPVQLILIIISALLWVVAPFFT